MVLWQWRHPAIESQPCVSQDDAVGRPDLRGSGGVRCRPDPRAWRRPVGLEVPGGGIGAQGQGRPPLAGLPRTGTGEFSWWMLGQVAPFTSSMPTSSSHPASVTKLFSTAAALVELGPDHRFETPVVRRGEIDAQGTLHGDLILIAQGDPSMGGRTGPDGALLFKDDDHTYAGGNPRSDIVPADPLAGLDHLARGSGRRHQACDRRGDRRRPALRVR